MSEKKTAMYRFLFILGFFFFIGCSVSEPKMEKFGPLSSDVFLNKPLGFPLTMSNFEFELGEDYRERTFIRTLSSDTSRKDTIYRFTKKGNSFIFYRTQNGKTSFLSAKIRHKKTPLTGNFHPGVSREMLNQGFTDINFTLDTCKFDNGRRQAVFIFNDKDKLKEIQLNNYYKR